MIVFPNCKINIGLCVNSKREDGFHNIETVFYPLPLNDALEVIDTATGPGESSDQLNIAFQPNEVIFSSGGLPIDGRSADNICVKAYNILKNDFAFLPAVNIHLHKVIPMGAGLGGGSSDGAFMLMALNERFDLHLGTQQLIKYALQLGSDCPFFIINQPCYATGRGELLTPLNIDLSPFQLVLVNPGIHVNTGWAFSRLANKFHDTLVNQSCSTSLPGFTSQPPETWKQNIVNDFETPVFEKYPAIKAIKQSFYDNGAVYASMSGSGSSVYGLFYKHQNPLLEFDNRYFVRKIAL